MQQTQRCYYADEEIPEPDENEDLLVEQVDGEDALVGVAVHVCVLANVEVAERDSREAPGLVPLVSGQQVPSDVQAKQVELVTCRGENADHWSLPRYPNKAGFELGVRSPQLCTEHDSHWCRTPLMTSLLANTQDTDTSPKITSQMRLPHANYQH